MNWYIAPVIDCPTHGVHPAMQKVGQDPSCGGVVPGTIIHCYTSTTCLVGATAVQSIAGWTSQTLQEAKDYYEAFYGVPPSGLEVY